MYILTAERTKIELTPVDISLQVEQGQIVVRSNSVTDSAGRLSRAINTFFKVPTGRRQPISARMITGIVKDEPKPAMFREKETGLLRLVHKEIALRFADNVNPKLQKKILLDRRLDVVSKNAFIPNQFIVKSKQEKVTGEGLLDLANAIMDMPEVVFATPNFVSEYQRHATATIPIEQWHLENTASVAGQKLHEDVNALKAWRESQGRGRPAIVVAVLDDGVDVEHPNLTGNVLRNPDPTQPLDLVGRDFYINDRTNAEHFNPRPKQFQYPYHVMTGNDIHGTPCAGVIAAAGKNGGALGIAPKCKVLPVKIFHGDNLASDANVADAIRYAAKHASILSCSWSGGSSPNIEAAIGDAGTIGRGGKGSAVICASGNEASAVGFPARHPQAIAVGASTDQAKLAFYSNTGPEICVVAPSNGGKRGIFTTDVSIANRGFNLGSAAAGGVDGLHTNDFGGTSSATPLVAGVAALVPSAHPNLTRDELRDVLKRSTIKIGPANAYDSSGHSDKFGHGRIDAYKAVRRAASLLAVKTASKSTKAIRKAAKKAVPKVAKKVAAKLRKTPRAVKRRRTKK